MSNTPYHGKEISADTYAALTRNQFNLESLGERLHRIENRTAAMKDKWCRGDEAMRDFTVSYSSPQWQAAMIPGSLILLEIFHTAPTVDKKALPSSREEFQFNLISKTWKSTGTRAIPICTSRSLKIPPEFFWEQSTKLNNYCEGSTCRPRWSAITLGWMLTDASVLHKACGNSIHCTVHEYSPNVFFFLSGFSEEHPQSVAVISFFEWLMVLPVDTLSSSIGSSPSSQGVLTGSGGCSEGLGLGLSALSRATSIFDICTRMSIDSDFVRAGQMWVFCCELLMLGGWCRSTPM
ncbi:hypothetical protein F2Q69_00042288 [Brassica cretica]|uniref:Uncharacterized protein n=1 Tax=Brassica cretica TaxID=69181 RepID=A0A8S9NEW3_BRACR|nr:hypothetical protein F2Q69_00042288 [Brassica cretica]